MENINREVARLQKLTVSALLAEYRSVFDEPSHVRHKQHLVRSILWGLQAQDEGGLSERALRRVAELVEGQELRVASAAPTRRPQRPQPRKPIPGTILCRPYKGQDIRVKVLEEGFEYEGHVFQTLSALAKSITGSHWNGYRFFGLPSQQRKGSSHDHDN